MYVLGLFYICKCVNIYYEALCTCPGYHWNPFVMENGYNDDDDDNGSVSNDNFHVNYPL
jgi:hypothetical protein